VENGRPEALKRRSSNSRHRTASRRTVCRLVDPGWFESQA